MSKLFRIFGKPVSSISPRKDQSEISAFDGFTIVSTTSNLLEERETGYNKPIYVLRFIYHTIGIGNFWRFPFLAYKNKGGSFVFCYIIIFFIIGIPLFLLESALGQFTSKGLHRAFHCVPLMKGLRYAMAMVAFYVGVYSGVLLSYFIFYWLFSFSLTLPWTVCRSNETSSCLNVDINKKDACFDLDPLAVDCGGYILSTESYWKNVVLNISAGIEKEFEVKNDTLVFVLFVWVLMYAKLTMDQAIYNKLVYFMSAAPLILLLVLLIQNLTMDGARAGLAFFLVPTLEEFLNPTVWKDAASQVIISLMTCTGTLITMSSFNHFQNNCYRDTLFATLFNGIVSLLAGIVVFTMIGHHSYILGVDVADAVESEIGISYVAYSGSIASLPASHFWSVAFYLIIPIIVLENMFCGTKTVMTLFRVILPDWISQRSKLYMATSCFVYFLASITLCRRDGIYWLNFLDVYAIAYPVLLIATIELLSISYLYGTKTLLDDIRMMVGITPHIIWQVMWAVISPAVLTLILITSVFTEGGLTLGKYSYPVWVNNLGWLFGSSSILFIPVCFGLQMKSITGTLTERFKKSAKPHKKWRPHQKDDRVGRYEEGYRESSVATVSRHQTGHSSIANISALAASTVSQQESPLLDFTNSSPNSTKPSSITSTILPKNPPKIDI